MYFQNLENSHSNISRIELEIFDSWLALLAPIYRKKISVIDFSVKNNLDPDVSIKLFDYAVEKNILKPKIIIVDDDNIPFGTYYKLDEIPDEIEDFENNTIFYVQDHNKELWFELISFPKETPISNNYLIQGKSEASNPKKNISFIELTEFSGNGHILASLGSEF